MAPRKPTIKPDPTDLDPTMLITSYLKAQNRPYSATDISSNLHNKVTKTKTDKLLKEMFERKEIDGKISGKQWVYWYFQDPKEGATPEELFALDASIQALRETIPILKADLKVKSASLATLRSAPTTDALRATMAQLENQQAEMQAQLKVLRSGSIKPISKEEKEKVEAEYQKWARKALTRKRIWKEAEGMLLEVMTKEELYEKLGIDDEA